MHRRQQAILRESAVAKALIRLACLGKFATAQWHGVPSPSIPRRQGKLRSITNQESAKTRCRQPLYGQNSAIGFRSGSAIVTQPSQQSQPQALQRQQFWEVINYTGRTPFQVF